MAALVETRQPKTLAAAPGFGMNFISTAGRALGFGRYYEMRTMRRGKKRWDVGGVARFSEYRHCQRQKEREERERSTKIRGA